LTRIEVITSFRKLGIAMNFSARSVDGFPWLASAMLAVEACEVISLRLAKLAVTGEDSDREAQLMVREKVDAMFEATASLMGGASAADIIDRYREHVAANAKRLSAI
jgi:hypothetical protein